MGKSVGDWLNDVWQKFVSLSRKIVLDNYAIFIFIFSPFFLYYNILGRYKKPFFRAKYQ